MRKPEIIDVNAGNVEREGFFCFMSKRKDPGWRAKLEWLKKRFPEGLRLKLLRLPERGFIEYAPGEWCWRPVEAKGYMVIHCLWVVGRSRGRGIATALLHECIEDAKRSRMKGVAMLANDSAYMRWKGFLAKRGFEPVDRAPGGYELMCLRFGKAAWPKFSGGWERKAMACGKGAAVLRTGQCPYFDGFTAAFSEAARKRGMPCRVIELGSAGEVRHRAPSPYGSMSVVVDGKALPSHYQAKEYLTTHGTKQGSSLTVHPLARSNRRDET